MAQGIYTLKAPEAVNKFKSLASDVGLYVGIVVYTAIGAKVRHVGLGSIWIRIGSTSLL